MLLDLNSTGYLMKNVYLLSEELKLDTQQVALTQALTLNKSRPQMGLKGTHGLFGSDEWWENIGQKKMPLEFFSGVITRAYIAGQDESGMNNTIELLLDDGSIRTLGIYVNIPEDALLFQIGHRADIVYVLDELKLQPAPDGGDNYSKIALEMAVSLTPVNKAV